MPRLLSGQTAAAMMVIALVVNGPAVRAQTPWYEGFEGPDPSWHQIGGNDRTQILMHRRVRGEAFTGDGCERLVISAPEGTHLYLGHDVGRPQVIDELLPTVRVKSDRDGLEMLVRIVLPRTKDPQTGQPVWTLVQGSSYAMVGRWAQLRVEDIPHLLDRQTRILRMQRGTYVDSREAYVDQVLLRVNGAPGVTNVWIDDLDVRGHVGAPSGTTNWPRSEEGVSPSVPGGLADRAAPPQGSLAGRRGPPKHRIQLDGSVLLVDGRPMFPRAIQYQGEPLELLEKLGFNTVWLDSPPESKTLTEAAQLGLWIVCPPATGSRAAGTPIGADYDPVLAWDLGRGLSTGDLASTRQWAEEVSRADQAAGRPLICQPQSELRAYSRSTDLLLLGRSPLQSSLGLTEYGTWVRQRSRLARPGTPIWTTVQTQPEPSLSMQWSGLIGGGQLPSAVCGEQIGLLAYVAVSAGSRGLLFQSRSPLDAADPDTRRRALALELLNLELAVIEPWLAGGHLVTIVQGSERDLIGVVLRTDRARLLVPIRADSASQLVPGQPAAGKVSFVVPGVPESNDAYLMMPGALRPLRHERVTGGTHVTLDDFGLSCRVLFTQDPLVVHDIRERMTQTGRQSARLHRDLALARWQAVGQVDRQLREANRTLSLLPAVLTPASPKRLAPQPPESSAVAKSQAAAWLAGALRSIQQADASLASGDWPAAYQHAQRAMRPLRSLERAYWEAAVASLPSPVSSPMAVSFATLPWHWELIDRIASARLGPNGLVAGDFEDLGTMLQAGWEHFQHPTPDLYAEAQLAAEAAHSGRYGLRLTARAADTGHPERPIETPPSWIRSAPVPVEAGAWIAIHGWVHVPGPITGSVDGLLIIDSLSGPPLAERVRQTAGWKEFTLYRTAARPGHVTVTFALSGLGEAWVDDVTIRPIPIYGTNSRGPDVVRRSGVRPR